uniref:MP n=1 Tax=Avocado citrivirus 1 TaxID=2794431 RepID=A0A7T5QZ99_9VIRU|nr:MP [Avocado citrivirus 1]
MSKLVSISNVMTRVSKDQSVLGSNEINKLYGDHAPLVFKDEVKMIVPGNVMGEPIKMQANILTPERLKEIRSVKVKGKNCAYLHLGVVPIVLQSLLPSGNDGIHGMCALVDTSRGSDQTGTIDKFNFEFSQSVPYAAKILVINAAVDLMCDQSVGSLQVLIELHGVDLRVERSVLAITTGLSCVPTNSSMMLPGLQRTAPKWSICNTIEVDESDEGEREAFRNLFMASSPIMIDMGNEEWLDEGKRYKLFGPKVQPVRRRNLTTKNLIKGFEGQVKSGNGELKRSQSVRFGRDKTIDFKIKNNFELGRSSVSSKDEYQTEDEGYGPERTQGISLEQLRGSGKHPWSEGVSTRQHGGPIERRSEVGQTGNINVLHEALFRQHCGHGCIPADRIPVDDNGSEANAASSSNRRAEGMEIGLQPENLGRVHKDLGTGKY